MKVWSRVKCAWVAWTGTRAAWLALPAAGAIVATACLPVIGLVRHMPLGPAHSTATAPPRPWVGYTSTSYATSGPQAPYPTEYVAPGLPSTSGSTTPPVGVPEPSSALLFATGLVALVAVLRIKT
jgi:hypothetical protein